MCDTVIQHYHALDSFYIVLLSTGLTFDPVITGMTNSILCANTTGTLTVSPTNPNYSWSGPGIHLDKYGWQQH